MEVSHRAVTHWLNVLETFYYHFRINPYARKKIRSIKKDPKLYLWDWSEIEDPAVRFENMVAAHLLKLCHFLYDFEGYRAELFFLRNVDKKEVDFLVTIDRKPWFAVETKLSFREVGRSINYFRERINIPHTYQVVKESGINLFIKGVYVVSADKFLSSLV